MGGRSFAASSATGSGAMVAFQFSQSRFWMVRVIGLPRVTPQRTPEEMWAWSRSIFMRPPRP